MTKLVKESIHTSRTVWSENSYQKSKTIYHLKSSVCCVCLLWLWLCFNHEQVCTCGVFIIYTYILLCPFLKSCLAKFEKG